MPYTDAIGDSGMYTGEINEDGLPHGKGKMKYENGVFYTGDWVNGSQGADGLRQRERILSGFMSWKGRAKSKDREGSGVSHV